MDGECVDSLESCETNKMIVIVRRYTNMCQLLSLHEINENNNAEKIWKH